MATEFDGSAKRIRIDSAEPDVIVKELYSEWKDWALTGNNLQYAQAFRTFGGDPTVEGQTAPAYYFLMNGWKVVVDGFDASFGYNLYSDDGLNPVITLNGGTALLNNSDVGIVKTALAKALDYQGEVHVDAIHGSPGTEYPKGTAADPVNNIADAVTIANAYNFHDIYAHSGTYTLTTEQMDDFYIHGDSPESVTIIFTGGATYTGTRFRQVTLTGTMSNSRVDLERCVVDNLTDFNGTMFTTAIKNTLRIDTDGQATLVQCFSGHPGAQTPILDMHENQSTTIAIRAYSGGLTITNCDIAGDEGTVEYLSGKCTIDSSCTAGYLSIRGTAKLYDNSVGTTVDTTALSGSLIDMSSVDLSNANINVDLTNVETGIANISTQVTNLDAKVDTLDTSALLTLLQDVHDVNLGRWQVDTVNNQLVIYRTNDTELIRFNLFDEQGNPTYSAATFDKVPV